MVKQKSNPRLTNCIYNMMLYKFGFRKAFSYSYNNSKTKITPKKMIKYIDKTVGGRNNYFFISEFKDGLIDITISKKKIKIIKDKFKRAEYYGDLFGYPRCCINKFLSDMKANQNKKLFSKELAPVYISYMRFEKKYGLKRCKSLGILCNKKTKEVSFTSHINHIPCSLRCKETKGNVITELIFEVVKSIVLLYN